MGIFKKSIDELLDNKTDNLIKWRFEMKTFLNITRGRSEDEMEKREFHIFGKKISAYKGTAKYLCYYMLLQKMIDSIEDFVDFWKSLSTEERESWITEASNQQFKPAH